MTVSEAAEHTGLSRSTIQRRVDLWLSGDRSTRAIKGGRTSGTVGDRLVDPVDAERARLQRLGDLAPDVTPDRYATQGGRER